MGKTRSFGYRFIAVLIVLVASLSPLNQASAVLIPVTSTSDPQEKTELSPTAALTEFAGNLQDGENILRGVYVDGVMALRVVQQPADDPAFVSSIAGVATQFDMAARYNTVGLLAHNFAAGSEFGDMQKGDVIYAIYGNGKMDAYRVHAILRYQALSPTSPTSSFVDLESGEKLSATELFNEVYKGDPHLVLQTCIAHGGESSWGRLFVLADPVDE